MNSLYIPRRISWIFGLALAFIQMVHSEACEFGVDWVRSDGPVLQSSIYDEAGYKLYEVAGDPHAFQSEDGMWHMIYSADDTEQISIKLATRQNGIWVEGPILLGPSQGQPTPIFKETSFYRLSSDGEHQVYFIGYADGETYQSEIYLAVADSLTGPYAIFPDPVVPRGIQANRDVYLMTSPSVVAYQDTLYMLYVGWDGFEDVSQVWSIGAISRDQGRSWTDFQLVEGTIGMEGQVTPTPDGRFAAVRTGEFEDGEAIFLSCAEHPFGPYKEQAVPILAQQGAPWEVDEITAPALSYDMNSGEPTLFYAGADHAVGWWVLSATPKK